MCLNAHKYMYRPRRKVGASKNDGDDGDDGFQDEK